MRFIKQQSPPRELIEYKLQPEAEYDGSNFTCVKDAIRQQLLKEQGFICAYCMKRISAHKMKIEHWHSQSRYPDEQLDYKNMLACCLGNEGHPIKNQTCDTRKGLSILVMVVLTAMYVIKWGKYQSWVGPQ